MSNNKVNSSVLVIRHLVAVNRHVDAAGAERVALVAVAGHDIGVSVEKSHAIGVLGSGEDAILAVGVAAVVVSLVGNKGRVTKGNDTVDCV